MTGGFTEYEQRSNDPDMASNPVLGHLPLDQICQMDQLEIKEKGQIFSFAVRKEKISVVGPCRQSLNSQYRLLKTQISNSV